MAGPWEKYQSPYPGYVPVGAPDPSKPLEIQGKQLGNTRTQQEIDQANATAAANTAKAKADALKAELDAKTAQEAWDTAHPKGTNATVLGPDSLKSLSVPDQELVKALADGRLAFPSGFALKAPWWQQKLEQVAAYDPTFDATNYNNRAKARAALTNGKLGTSANALNTAIGHVGLLSSQIPGTASHDFTPLNAVENWGSQLFGSSGITNFKDTAQKLASELTSVYRNGGGAEADVVRQLESLDPNASAEQKRGIIRNAMELLASKQAANLYQLTLGTGGKPDIDLLDPAARKVLDQFPDIRDKYFTGPPPPLSQAAAALLTHNGGTAPPPPPPGSPGIAPPPSGPTGPTGGNLGPSTNGYNDTPDPASAAYWDQAAHSGEPYRAAMAGWPSATGGKQIVSPPDPQQYAQAVQYMQAHPNVDYHPFESVTRTPVSGVSAILNGVAQSPAGAFVGHAANAATASLPQLAAGDQGTYWNAVSHQQNPTASTLGDITGTVAGAVGAGKGVKAIAPSLGRFGNLIGGNAARAGLTGDTLFGGVSGMAQNPDHPVLGGVLGATAMAAGNVGGRYVLGPALAAAGDTAVGQGIVNAGRRARGMFGGSAPQPFSPPSPLDAGPRAILGAGAKPFDDITANLQDASRLNLPYALADADPRLRVMAGSAARKSPDVRTLAEQTLIPRQLGQGERAIGQINNNLAPVGDVPTLQANILKAAQSQSRPLYAEAKSQPIPELTANPALKDILDRPAAQSAIRNGYSTALNNGEDVGSLTYATDPNGNQIAFGNPSWNVIHYARQELDKAGETATRHALDRQIAGINPAFKTADAAYSGVMKGSDALQSGAAATGIKVTPEATQQALAGFPKNGAQFQQGYASNMADMIERQRMSGNPYDLVNGSIGQQAKLATVFPQGAPNFMRAQGLEGDMAKTAYETLGGSPTAARFEADKAFDSPVADAAIDAGLGIAAGVPPTRLAMRGIQKLADTGRLGLGRAKADAVGPLLLNPDPNANLAALDQWIKMNAARQAYLSQVRSNAGQIGAGMFGAPLTYGLSQN